MRIKKTARVTAPSSSKVTIDRGIPIPDFPGRGNPSAYPWKEMAVGDSFLFMDCSKQNAYSLAFKASKKYSPAKFRVTKTPEGYRCWRVV